MVTKTATRQQQTVDLTDAYTPDEVARMLRVKKSTLSDWRCKGTPNKPPYVRLSRRVVLYPRAQYAEWANKQTLINPDNV